MTLHFQAFINDKIDVQLTKEWDGTLIEKVEVFKAKRSWKLYLLVPQPIPGLVIRNTIQQLSICHDYLDHIELNIVLKDASGSVRRILDARRDDLSSCLFLAGKFMLELPLVRWKIDNTRIDIICSDEALYNEIIASETCPRLADWFWQEYSIQILVRVLYQGKGQSKHEMENWLTNRQLDVIEPGKDLVLSGKRGFNSREGKKLEQAIHTKPLPVAELEEGMKTAVTEGEIWHKEINVLKDGRLVVSYYLTDFNDTIVIKAFLDKSENDRIKVGDRIRVKGSIRFDSRMKEIALFMDQYKQQEIVCRNDDNEDKRIELHAHTKMSAMDGLAEVKDLIHKAALWGHPAIAITDHGCIQSFPVAYAAAEEHNKKSENRIKIIYGVEGYLVEEDKKERPYHIILLARNLVGLKNLYKLISISYLDQFYRQPRMPRQELLKYREGLLLGTACEAGELFHALLRGAGDDELTSIASFYDYLEIQPRANNAFLIRKGLVESEAALADINRRIVELGRKMNKPVVATGDVHFVEPHHEKFRTIIKAGQDYEDAGEKLPLYFRTTGEMLEEFSYLGEAEARRVVIADPAIVSSLIEPIKPVPDGFYPPQIETAEQEINELTWEKAHSIYGRQLPEIVEERVKRELASINKYGFSVLYLIAHKLVRKSNEDGYLVGSRGSVGSSLVAFFTGITEVNALPPHYICPNCFYCEFIMDNSVGCGADLDDKVCPSCSEELHKNGFDIPFETFLGFEGDKVPDIDLNFSGDYQSRAHQYVEELFGSHNVFRAGTISTIADKTAFGFVKKYAEGLGVDLKASEMARLSQGITGVRRTTGQHPGGLIVVPKDKDILDFTPLQHPADNKGSGVITTHFEYHAIGDQLVKLDILGHDDPTVIKELEDLTGIKASSISLSEKETMRLFSGVEPLGVKAEDIDSSVGTYGIPEFGTRFVRQMLEVTRPTTFSELVRISGLSHGTDVWLNNAQSLISDKLATLNEVICTRDDIMTYLIYKDMDKNKAFEIMEKVRKGKGLKLPEVAEMEKCHIPPWYINSCQKIKYMFPKAHAVAYVTMAFRIAWFKVYYPLEFYASFFGIRAEDFEAETVLGGYDLVRERIKEIEGMGQNAPQKDKKLLTILELAMEMYVRGFHFYPVDIYKSYAHKFVVAGKGLILPFASLPNVGAAAAQGIMDSRDNGEYISIEEFQGRTRLNKSAMDILRKENCFPGLPEKTQISLFA
ncbi:MAG: PolC-type DNA polymerase III [Firmicutes bacterium HGW-Firmicutes-15]|nr:MAG: PolC-type DNA polymerase III [Firmicutes bacterium HGW-Firmicutes-15]